MKPFVTMSNESHQDIVPSSIFQIQFISIWCFLKRVYLVHEDQIRVNVCDKLFQRQNGGFSISSV